MITEEKLEKLALEKLAGDYATALMDEFEAQQSAADAKMQMEITEAKLVIAGYEEGLIAGKNAEARARAELLYLSKNERYLSVMKQHQETLRALAMAEGQRKSLGTLVKAWLCSQSGAPFS